MCKDVFVYICTTTHVNTSNCWCTGAYIPIASVLHINLHIYIYVYDFM